MQRKERLRNSKNFAVYYGCDMEKELSQFDVAILEPSGHDLSSVRLLKESGTLLISYLSAVEIHPSSPWFRLLSDDDFIKNGSKPLVNEKYGTYLADIRSKKWNGLLRYMAGSLLLKSEYDGLFLDTIGDIESERLAADLQDSLVLSAANLIRQIREQFPDHLIIQNNGIKKLCLYTSELIDGICWENPPSGAEANLSWVRPTIKRLETLKLVRNLQVLLLFEEEEKSDTVPGKPANVSVTESSSIIQTAKRNNFLLYRAPSQYLSKINPPAMF